MTKARTIEVGDDVRYTAMFLRSTGQIAGKAGFRRGKVMQIGQRTRPFDPEALPEGFAMVDWQDKGLGMVNMFNVCRINSTASYAL